MCVAAETWPLWLNSEIKLGFQNRSTVGGNAGLSLCGAHWAGIKPWASGWVDRVGSASLEMTRGKGRRETTRSNKEAAHSCLVIRARRSCRRLGLSLAGPPCGCPAGCRDLRLVAVTLLWFGLASVPQQRVRALWSVPPSVASEAGAGVQGEGIAAALTAQSGLCFSLSWDVAATGNMALNWFFSLFERPMCSCE